MTRLGTDTITIRRAPLVTAEARHGTQRRDWTTATSTEVTGCSVQPYSAAEATTDREFTRTHLRLFAPPSVDLAATDRVLFAGTTFEVDGTPERWRDSRGVDSHVEAALKRLAG